MFEVHGCRLIWNSYYEFSTVCPFNQPWSEKVKIKYSICWRWHWLVKALRQSIILRLICVNVQPTQVKTSIIDVFLRLFFTFYIHAHLIFALSHGFLDKICACFSQFCALLRVTNFFPSFVSQLNRKCVRICQTKGNHNSFFHVPCSMSTEINFN